MKVPAGIWLAAHALTALVGLRLAEGLARSHMIAGIGMGMAGGALVITLLAAVRYFVTSADTEAWDLREYVFLVHRLPRQADFLGTIVSCTLWSVICSTPLLTSFKIFWLASAVFASSALVRRYSYR